MFEIITDIILKKQAFFQRKAPIFNDVDIFFKEKKPNLCSYIKPFSYRNGILTLKADTPAFAQEFFFIKKELNRFLSIERKYAIVDIIIHAR